MPRSVQQVVVAALLSLGLALNAFVPASAAVQDPDPVDISSSPALPPLELTAPPATVDPEATSSAGEETPATTEPETPPAADPEAPPTGEPEAEEPEATDPASPDPEDEPAEESVDEPDAESTAETPPKRDARVDDEADPTPDQVQPLAEVGPLAEISPFAAGNTCSYANANTGSYARTLCWLDLTGFTTAYTDRGAGNSPRYVSVLGQAYGSTNTASTLYQSGTTRYGPVTNYPIEVELSTSHVLTATLTVTASTTTGLPVTPVGFPTWSGAFLGNSGFYTGVDGAPALYHAIDAGGATTTVRLGDIAVTNTSTTPATRTAGYSIVVADAESTDNNESITWSTSGSAGFRWLPNNPTAWAAAGTNATRKTAAVGNACAGTATGNFTAANPATTPRSCTPGSSQPSPKTGTAMLQASPTNATTAFSVTQAMLGGGKQAVAFGIVLGGARVNVQVADRVVGSTGAATDANFSASFSGGGSTFSTSTGTPALTAPTDSQYLPLDVSSGTQLTFASSVSGTAASSYQQSWVCLRSTPDTTTQTRWPTTGSSASPPTSTNAQIKGGEFLDCTVTYSPPYLSLVKTVVNTGTTATNTAAQFTLTATGQAAPTSTISGPGNAAAAVTKRAVAVGTYALTETAPTGTGAWQFGYTWTNLTCTGATPTVTRDPESNAVTTATAPVALGGDVTCTYTNTANAPRLVVSKAASPASGTTVPAGQVVTYTLTFDNTAGTAAMAVDHLDHLRDVLDDATYVAGSVRYGSSTATAPSSTSPLSPGITAAAPNAQSQMAITGTVPARGVRTMSFQVTVKPNAQDASQRQDAAAPLKGYLLRNHLTARTDPVPETCATASTTCTENPVRAWTLRKDSQPEDGAMIHSGGNIYYRVKITNYSGQNLTGVRVRDDLTETLAAATWDPTAPVAVPVPYGLSFYDAAGQLLGSSPWNPTTGPKPVASGTWAFDDQFPGGLPFPGGTWTFETPAFDVPAQIGGTAVAYAIVGYVVRGGHVASPADPTAPYTTASSPSGVSALPHATWVNTAQAVKATIGGQQLYPNRCSAEGAGVPPGWQDTPEFLAAYGDCKTYHLLGESYFHVWKKDGSAEAGDQDNGVLGASFLLADTEDDARAGTPSRWLCRAANNPYAFGSSTPSGIATRPSGLAYAAPGSDPASGGAADFGAGSATRAAIAAWNADHPADQRQTCGLFFRLEADSEGQAAGSWRAVDVRGGDTDAGGGPLPSWRTASALNVAGNPSRGIHGTYWLAETAAPQDFQLLAQPMRLWVAPAAASPGGLSPQQQNWYDYQGRLSLPVVGVGESAAGGAVMPGPQGVDATSIRASCANPWQLPPNNQPNCIMPTGWTMPVFDVKLRPLPLTGGSGRGALLVGALAALTASLAGVVWRRRRAPGPEPGGGHP